MKTLYITLTIVCISVAIQAQEVRIHLDGGASSPFGNFTELNPYASTGASINAGASYFFTKKLGFGLELGTFNNPIENNLTDFTNSLDFETITTGVDNVWRTNYGTLGPILRLGNKELTFEISPQVGIASYSVPDYKVTYFSELLNRDLIIQEQEATGNVSSIFSSLTARLGYQISNSFGVYFKAGVQTNELFGEHSEQRLRYKNLTDLDGDDSFSEEEIIESPNQEDLFCSAINTFQTNIGVTYSIPLGNGENDVEETETAQEIGECQQSILKEPYDNETFFAASGTVPEFRWINHTDKRARSFVFELHQNGVKLIEKKVRSTSYKLSKSVTTDLYKIKASKEYQWRVRTEYDNCETTITDFNTFVISPSESGSRAEGECEVEFTNIEINCDTPAFDSAGNVRYTGTFTIKNNSNTPGIIMPNQNFSTSQDFDVDIVGATLTYSQSGTIGSACFPTPMILIPGQGAALTSGQQTTYCFELSVPIGTTTLNFITGLKTKPGTADQSICNTSKSVTLDNCICDTCEDWNFVSGTNAHLQKFPFSNPDYNYVVHQDLSIIGADPINEIKAEIISVKHKANDPQCYSCTKHEQEMGLMSFNTRKPQILGAPSSEWSQGADAIIGKDINGDNYSNQAIWKATIPVNGVDMSLSRRFILPMSLPKNSTLDCCEYDIEVCVRYTFTDINCITCTYDDCYTVPGNVGNNNGNGTSTGTGVGNGNQQTGNTGAINNQIIRN